MFLEKDTLESVKELEVDTTPVKVLWHSKINQVKLLRDDTTIMLQFTACASRL